MTGRNGKIGPVPVTPSRPLSQPHWKTATVIPIDAREAEQRRDDGGQDTTAERNRISSMRKPRPTTTLRNSGMASVSTVLKSATIAVAPPT